VLLHLPADESEEIARGPGGPYQSSQSAIAWREHKEVSNTIIIIKPN